MTSPGLFGQTSLAGFGLGPTSSSTTGTSSSGLFSQQTQATNLIAPSTNPGLFGQIQTSGIAQPSAGLFGQTQTSNTASSSGLFGPTQTSYAAAPSSTGMFGQVQTSNTAAPSTGLFGQTQTSNTVSSSGLFGPTQTNNTAASSTGLFGQSAPGSTPGIFSQPTSSQPTLSSTGPSFGISTNPSSVGLFSQTSNAPTSSGINFGISAATGTSSSGFSFPSSSTSASVASSSVFQPICIGNTISKDGKSKEITLPQDTIAMFEAYKDKEKKCSEDNVRQTATPFHKLVEDTKKLRQHIVQLSNQHNQLHTSARKLKSAVIQEAENVEMARRTQDTPMNFQGDNKAPEQFFLRLVRSFEERMTFCRNRIEEVEKCARSNGGVSEITSEDMKEVLKKEHEMVKMLAAKIYTLHNQLINYTNQSSNPDIPQPEALFRRGKPDHPTLGISHKNSSIARPALGEDGSGLLNFQNGQQRAKAFSLGAAPPTLPLNQTSIPTLIGSPNQNSLFGGSSNSFLNFNTGNTNTGNFSSANKPSFGSNPTNTSSLFGNQSMNQIQPFNLFGSSSNTSAVLSGGQKSFKKSQETEETQRKRRM